MADPIQVSHNEAATALLTKIRALRSEVPRFVAEAPVREKRRLILTSSVPDPFVESASVAVQSSVRLESAAGADGAALRDAFEFARAYEAVLQELRAFTRAVAHTIRVQRGEAGSRALDVLAVARRLARHADGAELLPRVEDMQRKLKMRRTRRTTPDPASEPSDASAPPKAA